MAFAALVSAVAWVDAWINRRIQGSSYHKAYLFPSRDKVLADPVLIEGLDLATNYHGQKDLWPRFLEVANGQRGDARIGEEAASKYFAFCGVTAGAMAGWLLGVLTALAVAWAL
jgi:hypothetical protein